jgi:hypothetical protein
MTENKKMLVAPMALFAFSAFTLFWNLGDRLLWGDEAETALLAVNITKFGLPVASDGRNVVTLLGVGKDTNAAGVWTWSPWLDEYAAAASFAVFGNSTFAARFPFALAGLAGTIFFAYFAHRVYRRNDVTLFATLLFATNASIVLHARQCRYYAIVVLAQMLLLYGCHAVYKGRARSGAVWIVVGLVAQWYCNYILATCNALAVVLAAAAFRRLAPQLLKPFLVSIGIFAAAALPWLLYAGAGQQSGLIGFQDFSKKVFFYTKHVLPYLVPIVIGLTYFRNASKNSGRLFINCPNAEELATYAFLFPLFAAYFAVLLVTPGYFYRYLVPLIPVLILCFAHVVCLIADTRCRYGAMAAVFLVFNAVPCVRLLADITSHYENSVGDVVAFLNKNAKPDDRVYVPDPAFPVIFHTGLRVIDARLTHRLDTQDLPEWIMSESPSAIGGASPIELPPALASLYTRVLLRVHDSPRGDSRPDPAFHAWFTSPGARKLIIYMKKG